MTKIISFSGRKNSGKTTSANFLYAATLCSLGIIDKFRFTDDGTLEIATSIDGEEDVGAFDPLHPDNIELMKTIYVQPYDRYADKFIGNYYFADDLKQKVCIDILGLSYEQCYGTEEQKNSLTNLRWENMPGIVPICGERGVSNGDNVGIFDRYGEFIEYCRGHNSGNMTAREVMQFVGTEIFRKMYGNVWVDSTIRRIQRDSKDIALIGDCRFPNEVQGIQAQGGKVIRLLRNPYPDDTHPSETALDHYNDFDFVIDNRDCSIQETNKQIETYLRSIDWFPSYLLPVGQA